MIELIALHDDDLLIATTGCDAAEFSKEFCKDYFIVKDEGDYLEFCDGKRVFFRRWIDAKNEAKIVIVVGFPPNMIKKIREHFNGSKVIVATGKRKK